MIFLKVVRGMLPLLCHIMWWIITLCFSTESYCGTVCFSIISVQILLWYKSPPTSLVISTENSPIKKDICVTVYQCVCDKRCCCIKGLLCTVA